MVWAGLLFADLNRSLESLRHLVLLQLSRSWSAMVLNHEAVSGTEQTSVPALARLLLTNSGASHVTVPGVITFREADLPASPCAVTRSSKDVSQQVIPSRWLEGSTLPRTNL